MEPRIDYMKAGRGAIEAMLGLEKYLRQSGLEESLLNLVRMRASQINGCAYCLDMHWKDARALGETEQRLYGLDAWEESPYYTIASGPLCLDRSRDECPGHSRDR